LNPCAGSISAASTFGSTKPFAEQVDRTLTRPALLLQPDEPSPEHRCSVPSRATASSSKRWIFPEPIESVSVKHHDGTIDSFQRARVGSELDSTQLERLYWDEIPRVTLRGEVSRGAIRVGGFWPVILRFGPLVDGRRPITGGLFPRGAGGTIGWLADGEHTAVIVQGFAPLLGGPF
jgi:hypothetical protein